MTKLKLIIISIFSVGLFLLAIKPVTTYDTFYNLKIGEQIVKTGRLPVTEIFSWAAYGRPWIPYEWMAQSIEFLMTRIGGFLALEMYVSSLFVLFFLTFFSIYNYIFGKDFFKSLGISIFLSASIYEFFVPRPHLIGYLCFIALLFIILLYILKNKNLLFLTIPLTYFWANSHASFIFIPYFLFSFGISGYFYFLIQKNTNYAVKTIKTLSLYGIISIGITLLPPLSYKSYVLLWQFFTDLKFFSTFVTEWLPLSSEPVHLALYSFIVVTVLTTSILIGIKKKQFFNWFLILPLLPTCLMAFFAIRHFVFGLTSTLLILGMTLKEKQREKEGSSFFKIFNYFGAFILLVLSACLIYQARTTAFESNLAIPFESIKFLQENNLKGRMFNEVAMGGYFIYYLYPQYQVFFDGRADIYHCCEMRYFWQLVANKNSSRSEFKNILYPFLDKYKFSYLVLSVADYNPLTFTSSSLIADTLLDDPNWRLIYFSDNIEIIVKNDGNNSKFFNNLGITAATPNRITSYRKNQEKIAEKEYIKMIALQDSGVARNALGEVLKQQGKTDGAEVEFKAAIRLNSRLGKPYYNLGKIAMENKQNSKAINYFSKALEISPYLGEIYLNLAKIYSDNDNNLSAATILNKGLSEKIDLISRQKIFIMLQNLRVKELK